jgi:archaeosine synthase beta-subunit
MTGYPDGHAARDRFIISRRPPRPSHDPWRAPGVEVEDERTETGATARVATVFLTGRECPWRCAMCDLWQHTTAADTPPGAIAMQVRAARAAIDRDHPHVTRIKLYNAGSFFDPRAVPDQDVAAVAAAVRHVDRVIVESHPALVGRRTRAFIDHLRMETGRGAHLEVAMGLETMHPEALARLNKRMSLDDVRRAADRVHAMGAAVRLFLLVSPPFIPPDAQDEWLQRSVDAAFEAGATVVSLIPTRHGNGALDALALEGLFTPPHLCDLERSLALALARPRSASARVFADLWDLARFVTCPDCLASRRARLAAVNRQQRVLPAVACLRCGGSSADGTPA